MVSPTVYGALGITFGALASLLMVISVGVNEWEEVIYSLDTIEANPDLVRNESQFYPDEGFYQVALKSAQDSNKSEIFYVRNTKGGIWRFCDKISDSFRKSAVYQKAIGNAPHLNFTCFSYITQFTDNQHILNDNAFSLVRMQNSAASCQIVALLCLVTAAITGTFSLWQRQVSACMVTGVMYIVSGVFVCFALVIMLTKVGYMRTECYNMDPIHGSDLCSARDIHIVWAVPVAWVAFSFFLVACLFWQLLARCMRLEKAKAMI